MLQKYHIFLKSTLWMTSLSCFFLLWQGFSTINLINTLFLVSLFFFCVYGFKWIIDQGTFYTFEYSWQKTKRYVLFFLPKYWSIKDTKDRNNDYDEETGEKFIIHSKNFMNINKVKNGTTSISFYGQRSSFLPLPSFYHSYISNKKVLNLIGQNFFHLLSYSI